MTVEAVNIKQLVIQAGKRYVMRYGGVTGVIVADGLSGYVWSDGLHTWDNDGHYYSSEDRRDLIAEYTQPEPLTFELKAGERYETVNPDGTAGPIVHITGHTNEMWSALACFTAQIDNSLFLGTAQGKFAKGERVYQIVRPYVEPPKPTPIERLEQWRSQYGVPSAAVPDLDAIIADLKASVKP